MNLTLLKFDLLVDCIIPQEKGEGPNLVNYIDSLFSVMADIISDDGFPSTSRRSNKPPRPASSASSWTTVPPTVKRIFDKFPLVTYPDTVLPSACIFPDQSSKIGTAFVHDLSNVSIFPDSVRLLVS